VAFACALLAASAFNSLPFELINQTAPEVLAVRAGPCRWRRAVDSRSSDWGRCDGTRAGAVDGHAPRAEGARNP
jgi:hypothetical protein